MKSAYSASRDVIARALVLFILLAATNAGAGVIVQDAPNAGALNISGASPIGQSFTAEDASIQTIGFRIFEASLRPGPLDFSITLYRGEGFAGEQLKKVEFTLPHFFSGFADADFTGVSLVVGSKYTAQIFAANDGFMVNWHQHSFTSGVPIPGQSDYTGGDAYYSNGVVPYSDLNFHVLPAAGTIPEPSSLIALIVGLLALRLAPAAPRMNRFPRSR